jgi:hypothetical protein
MADETKRPELPTFQWVESERAVPEIYGNFLNYSWTLADVRFQIGQLIPKKPGDLSAGFVIEERAFVTIGWYQTKILRDMLASLIASYEQVNGEIKMPKLAPVPPTPPTIIGP